MKLKQYVLRRKTGDSEGDKYDYLMYTTKSGLEVVTPFKSKATTYTDEDVWVVSKDWIFVKANLNKFAKNKALKL